MTAAPPPVVAVGDDEVTARHERDQLLAIFRALTSERDTSKLLDLILAKSRLVTGADAGSIYVLEAPDDDGDGRPDRGPKLLHFMLSQNDSTAVDFKARRLSVDAASVVGRAVLEAQPINIPDLERLEDPGGNPSGLAHNRTFDETTGYRARSMLTVPLLSAERVVIGVVQLINRKRNPDVRLLAPRDFDEQVIPFDGRAVELALALAAQAGICLENAMLYKEITHLFEGFVDAAVTAIEARDPTTSGHSRRVADMSVALAEVVDGIDHGPFRDVRFSAQDLKQLSYAGVLHDFGKVGVREHVLIKAKKLYEWQRSAIELRLRYLRKALEAETLRRKVEGLQAGKPQADLAPLDQELAQGLARVDEIWRLVLEANEPTVIAAPTLARLTELAGARFVDEEGHERPYLEPDELAALAVPRGSLTTLERQQIQQHVTHTMAFLDQIPWGRALRNVPRIAGAHHELLDGSGYPRGVQGQEIPLEARMLTIADIFDALVAADRPYKAAVPIPRALAILEQEVKAGRCDGRLFELFVGAAVYKRAHP